jgi:hypothetical protein
MFLTDAEVADLTGYKQARKQVAILKMQGVPYHLNAAGHPKVARAIIEQRYAKAVEKAKEWTPAWVANRL